MNERISLFRSVRKDLYRIMHEPMRDELDNKVHTDLVRFPIWSSIRQSVEASVYAQVGISIRTVCENITP